MWAKQFSKKILIVIYTKPAGMLTVVSEIFTIIFVMQVIAVVSSYHLHLCAPVMKIVPTLVTAVRTSLHYARKPLFQHSSRIITSLSSA